jgi:hypothetical protein
MTANRFLSHGAMPKSGLIGTGLALSWTTVSLSLEGRVDNSPQRIGRVGVFANAATVPS